MKERYFVTADLNQPPHAELVFDLLWAHQKWLLHDEVADPVSYLESLNSKIRASEMAIEVAVENDLPVGVALVEFHPHKIGLIGGALLPENSNIFSAAAFFKMFIRYCFDELQLRKLETEISTQNKNAELVAKMCGFRKEGLRKEALVRKGKSVDMLLFGLTRLVYGEQPEQSVLQFARCKQKAAKEKQR